MGDEEQGKALAQIGATGLLAQQVLVDLRRSGFEDEASGFEEQLTAVLREIADINEREDRINAPSVRRLIALVKDICAYRHAMASARSRAFLH